LTRTPPAASLHYEHLTRETRPELTYQGRDLLDCFDKMNAEFVQSKWSDGFPLVPPTRDKVEAMVKASGLPAGHIVGHFEPSYSDGTVEKIAANAVMAGCTPEMMPVLIAMAKAMVDPTLGARGVCMSTGPQATVVMVSGPYAKEIGMNNGVCAIGPGSISHVNVKIGRAAQLIRMNVGGAYPGVTDMDTHGTTMKFSYCVAENEERNPWEPFRVTKGYSRDSTTVTVNCPFSAVELHDFENHDPKKLIEVFCSSINSLGYAMTGYWLTNTPGPVGQPSVFRGDSTHLLFLCPDHAAAFHRAGWSLQDIRQALFEGSRMSFRELMLAKTDELFTVCHPHLQWLRDAPETKISVHMHPEVFDLFVVGADAGWSTFHNGGTYSITREVKVNR